jgi:hypothetical protein
MDKTMYPCIPKQPFQKHTMKKLFLALIVLTVSFASQTLPSRATEPVITPPSSGSVTFSVTTDGYSFTPVIGSLIPPAGGTTSTTLKPQGFTVGATLENHTNQGISGTIASGILFEYTVYNSNGQEVWDSLPLGLPQFILLTTLPPGGKWHSTAFVPLFINGKPLPAGTYTLDASHFGSPEFSATTTFVVNPPFVIN